MHAPRAATKIGCIYAPNGREKTVTWPLHTESECVWTALLWAMMKRTVERARVH